MALLKFYFLERGSHPGGGGIYKTMNMCQRRNKRETMEKEFRNQFKTLVLICVFLLPFIPGKSEGCCVLVAHLIK